MGVGAAVMPVGKGAELPGPRWRRPREKSWSWTSWTVSVLCWCRDLGGAILLESAAKLVQIEIQSGASYLSQDKIR